MKLKLTCTLDGTPIALELDGVPQTVVGERAVYAPAGGTVVFEFEAEPEPAAPDETPPTQPPAGSS